MCSKVAIKLDRNYHTILYEFIFTVFIFKVNQKKNNRTIKLKIKNLRRIKLEDKGNSDVILFKFRLVPEYSGIQTQKNI